MKNTIIISLAVMAFMPTEVGTRLLVPAIAIAIYYLYKLAMELYRLYEFRSARARRKLKYADKLRRQKFIAVCNKIHDDMEE